MSFMQGSLLVPLPDTGSISQRNEEKVGRAESWYSPSKANIYLDFSDPPGLYYFILLKFLGAGIIVQRIKLLLMTPASHIREPV